MNAVKERIIGAVTIMSNEDAKNIWEYILDAYTSKQSTWDDIEEVEATPEEIKIFEAYRAGDPEYQPAISSEELKRELDL